MTGRNFFRTFTAFAVVLCFLVMADSSVEALGQEVATVQSEAEPISRVMPVSPTRATTLSLNLDNVTLEEAIRRLAERTDYRFSYSSTSLPSDRRVSMKIQGVTPNEALHKLVEEAGITYEISKSGHVIPKERLELSEEQIQEVAAQHTVRGTVTDAGTGEPVPGVNIVVQETTIGTTTNANGEYELEVPSGDVVLVFSFVGYQTAEVPVEGRTEIDVTLEESIATLDEMVVIGYGTTERRGLTTSISRVENADLDQQPTTSPESALAGRLAGVSITHTRSGPGRAPVIRVRGPSSVTASNDPLIVIDGIPGASFNDVDMNDIESIEVLKDASATAIYGSRGAGGVVIITTKSGEAGEKPRFNFNSYVGMQYPMLHGEDAWVPGGEEYREMLERYVNRDWFYQGGDPSIPMWGDDRRPAQYQVNPVVAEGDYNWEQILFDPAPVQNYNLSVSGMTDDVNYYVSGTYRDQQGVFGTEFQRRYSLRANVLLDITDNIRADFRLSPSYTRSRNRVDAGIHNSIKMPPFLPPEWNEEAGRHYAPRDLWGHVVSAANSALDAFEFAHSYTGAFRNIAEGRFEFDLLEGLTFATTAGATLQYGTTDNFTEARSNHLNQITGSAIDSRGIDLLSENVLSYDTNIGNHSISSVAGASYQKEMSRYSWMGAIPNTFPNEIVRTLNNAEINPGSYTTKTHWGLASYFGRVNYDYDGRYMLSLSLRRDGSSRFGPENRWGTFPAASAGWIVTEESFMPDFGFLNELKVRASYGVTGNFGIGNFTYLGGVSTYNYAIDGSLSPGQAQNSFGNEDLQWETTESVDVGVDLSLFEDRLNLTFDYYDQQTSDMLYNVSIPSTSGFTSTMLNVGDINNSGIELELSAVPVMGDFTWETSFNFSRNRNKVTSLYGDVEEVINTHYRGMGWILRVGEPMFSFYGYEMIGVHQDEQSFEEYPHKPGAPLGSAIYKDQNGDGVIDSDDRVILGNFMPDFQWGMTHNFYWNNFDLGITLNSHIGGYRWNHENLFYMGPTASAFLIPAIEGQWWSPEEPGDGTNPATSLSMLDYVGDTDYFLEPADFLAIRNINFGYTLPESLVNQVGVNSFRLYLSVQNPFNFHHPDFTAYSAESMTAGEISSENSLPGINEGSEPILRTMVLGINMSF